MAAVLTAAVAVWRGYTNMPDSSEQSHPGRTDVYASTHHAIPRAVPPGLAERLSPTSKVKTAPEQQPLTDREQVPRTVADQLSNENRRTRAPSVTTIRARLESLETRCDLLEQALQRTRQEAAWGNVEVAASSHNDDSPDTDTSDIAIDTNHCQAANPKGRQKRKSVRSARSGSPSAEQLPHKPVSKNTRRQRRVTDLNIDGNEKLSSQSGGNTRRRLRRSVSWLG